MSHEPHFLSLLQIDDDASAMVIVITIKIVV